MILGFDIGGTKCAVVTANWDGSEISIIEKKQEMLVYPMDIGKLRLRILER